MFPKAGLLPGQKEPRLCSLAPRRWQICPPSVLVENRALGVSPGK